MSEHWTFGWDEIAAFANAGAIVVAALVGGWGVKRWQTERVETRQTELAEEALALMYRAPEVFDDIRNIAGYSGEGSTRHREEGETVAEASARDSEFIPLERINSRREYFERVIEIRPSIKAIFGKDKAAPLDKVLKVRSTVIMAAHMISALNGRTHVRTEQQLDQHFERIEEYQAVIWKGMGEPDQIDAELREAIAEMESTAEPILRLRLRTAGKN